MSPVNEYRVKLLQFKAIRTLAQIVLHQDVLPTISLSLIKELLELLARIVIRTKIPMTLRDEMLYVQMVFTEIKKIEEGRLE